MSTKPKYYIVEASALPEVFLKVAEAKRLLSTGEASTVNEATKMTDISRSAFYKYRDAVLPFQNMMTGRVITLQLLLHDQVGLLSELLDVFADTNVNILAEFTGNKEAVLTVHNVDQLKKIIKTVSVTASQVASQSASVGVSGNGSTTPADAQSQVVSSVTNAVDTDDALKNVATDLKKIGILKEETDVDEFVNKSFKYFDGVPDSYKVKADGTFEAVN